MATIEFWYEFASTYSYPAAMRIEEIAAQNRINVKWRPFLLGPIFKQQGWTTSPFKVYPEKGEYMWRDVERICQFQKIPFTRPSSFPQNSVLAARLALCPDVSAHHHEFAKLVYTAEFAEQKDISLPETLATILTSMNIDAQQSLEQATSPNGKAALRANTELAIDNNIFGAPFFITSGGERFWGNDRLEQAVAWQVS